MIKTIVNYLLSHQISISKTTERSKLLKFFKEVKPYITNHNLVRIGGGKDGGYLVLNDFENIKYCFSPGVSGVANFENDLTEKGIKCFLADYSVEGPPIQNALFDFEKKFLGNKNDDINITLESWVNSKVSNDNELILQMDIEGSEYSVIYDCSHDFLKKFRIVIIEFHKLDLLFNKSGYELIDLTFSKLLNNFEVVHIHPNNNIKPINILDIAIPPVMEFTFLRKDRIAFKHENKNFPHALDSANVETKDDFVLPSCWY